MLHLRKCCFISTDVVRILHQLVSTVVNVGEEPEAGEKGQAQPLQTAAVPCVVRYTLQLSTCSVHS